MGAGAGRLRAPRFGPPSRGATAGIRGMGRSGDAGPAIPRPAVGRGRERASLSRAPRDPRRYPRPGRGDGRGANRGAAPRLRPPASRGPRRGDGRPPTRARRAGPAPRDPGGGGAGGGRLRARPPRGPLPPRPPGRSLDGDRPRGGLFGGASRDGAPGDRRPPAALRRSRRSRRPPRGGSPRAPLPAPGRGDRRRPHRRRLRRRGPGAMAPLLSGRGGALAASLDRWAWKGPPSPRGGSPRRALGGFGQGVHVDAGGEELSRRSFDESLEALRRTGVRWISLRVPAPLRRGWEEASLDCEPSDGDAPDPSVLAWAVRRAHRSGLLTALGPPFFAAVSGGRWSRGTSAPGPAASTPARPARSTRPSTSPSSRRPPAPTSSSSAGREEPLRESGAGRSPPAVGSTPVRSRSDRARRRGRSRRLPASTTLPSPLAEVPEPTPPRRRARSPRRRGDSGPSRS